MRISTLTLFQKFLINSYNMYSFETFKIIEKLLIELSNIKCTLNMGGLMSTAINFVSSAYIFAKQLFQNFKSSLYSRQNYLFT